MWNICWRSPPEFSPVPRWPAGPGMPSTCPRSTACGSGGAVSVFIASLAVTNLVEAVYPGLGGVFGNGLPAHPPLHGMALMVGESVIALLVTDALRRGRAAAWWVATVGASFVVLNSVVNTRGPVRIVDLVCAATILVVLLTYRNSWRWRTPDGFARRSLRRVVIAVLAFGTALVVSIACSGSTSGRCPTCSAFFAKPSRG